MSCFPCLVSADYLNNLSPDSKEYEDTQGTAAERSSVTGSQRVLAPTDRNALRLFAGLLRLLTRRHSVARKSLFFLFSASLLLRLPLSFCLCCSCLGDRVRGSRPSQRQPEAGGEFTLDTLHVFITFRPLGFAGGLELQD